MPLASFRSIPRVEACQIALKNLPLNKRIAHKPLAVPITASDSYNNAILAVPCTLKARAVDDTRKHRPTGNSPIDRNKIKLACSLVALVDRSPHKEGSKPQRLILGPIATGLLPRQIPNS